MKRSVQRAGHREHEFGDRRLERGAVLHHVVPADLMQASAVMATVLYHAANREEKLPRKPLPRPLAER